MIDNDYITINSLQHYAFCPHQWGLMELEKQWSENSFVVLGNILHNKVDDPFRKEKRNKYIYSRSLPVVSHKYKIQGVCDMVEFVESDSGVYIDNIGKKCIINVVEYKRGFPKENNVINNHDAIQLIAQMLCVNEMFGCESRGFIYYGSIARRVELSNITHYIELAEKIIKEIYYCILHKNMPPINYSNQCKSCSLYNICLPKSQSKKSFIDIVNSSWSNNYEKTS